MNPSTPNVCSKCGPVDGVVIPGPHAGGHHAKVECDRCSRWIRWLPKEDGDRVKRPAAHRNLAEKYGEGFCQMCRKTRDELPPGQTFEAQHVKEYQDGGTNDRENIWIVCTACHKLIHWVRHWR